MTRDSGKNGGWSEARLERMHDVLAGHVARGAAPGLVTLVARDGEVRVDTIGMTEVGGDEPMRRDTIFRVASMTKPVTAVAAMILIEECKLRLDDPVDPLVPELADRRVLNRLDGPLDDTVPANRPITVRDLLTFRFGFGVITTVPPGTYPIQRAWRELSLGGDGPPGEVAAPGSDEWMRRLGTLPLMHQPGESWRYHVGADVLGVVIERVAGQSLESFFRERIFAPMGMKDTGFSVPAAELGRLATSYGVNAETGALELFDRPADGAWSSPPAFESGGGGLVSTVDDFLLFGRMLLNKGKLGGERILSRPSVEAMTTDQLTAEQKAGSGFFPGYWDSRGWGFGLSVLTRRESPSSVPGRFGWDGGLGTSWWSDPAEDVTAILMTQRSGFPLTSELYLDFWTSVYQAIDD